MLYLLSSITLVAIIIHYTDIFPAFKEYGTIFMIIAITSILYLLLILAKKKISFVKVIVLFSLFILNIVMFVLFYYDFFNNAFNLIMSS
jgi:hypothetical protein